MAGRLWPGHVETLRTWACCTAHIVSRIDYRLKDRLQREQALEFVWDGVAGLAQDRQGIFTHVMDNRSYCTPYVSPGVYFDNPWAMPPVNASNIDDIASFLAADMRERATYMRTDLLLYPGGYEPIKAPRDPGSGTVSPRFGVD